MGAGSPQLRRQTPSSTAEQEPVLHILPSPLTEAYKVAVYIEACSCCKRGGRSPSSWLPRKKKKGVGGFSSKKVAPALILGLFWPIAAGTPPRAAAVPLHPPPTPPQDWTSVEDVGGTDTTNWFALRRCQHRVQATQQQHGVGKKNSETGIFKLTNCNFSPKIHFPYTSIIHCNKKKQCT